ncbi:MAG: S8 family serine peptidase [Lachnospiraceae bacterium]|nr:S8 family serine peptidase [Lachnospiraceae bacterium]
MNRGRIRKTVISLMAVLFLVVSASETVFAYDAKRMETYPFSEKDFSSCRLLVEAEDASVFPEGAPILSSYNDTFLLQYPDQESAKKAYLYYMKQADAVDVDSVICICDEEDKADLEEMLMTEEDNPLAELVEAVSVSPFEKYDVALIDTGANEEHVRETVSLIGDDPADHNGHGTRMARFMAEENEEVSILSIKAIGDDGRGAVSSIYAAIEYAISQKIGIISLSASAAAADNLILKEAVKRATDQGIVFVGAAGNQGGYANQYVPGCIETATIIGACNQEGKRIPSSNYGPTVDYYVTAMSTSEAAARFSGLISLWGINAVNEHLNQGKVFTDNITQSQDDAEEYYYTLMGSGFTVSAVSQQFCSVQGIGDDDVLYYTYTNGVWTAAYCIDHGKGNPNNDSYAYNQTTNNILGYIMRNGYPNNQWGLSWQEAQYLTQAAVFGSLGVDFYSVSDGMHSPYWIWNHIWGDGSWQEGSYIGNMGDFQYAVNLLNNARRNASSEDAKYVNYWSPSNSYLQRMITPARAITSLKVIKTTAATGSCKDQLKGNAMYSEDFQGAKFSVRIYDSFAQSWGEVTTYETGADGTFIVNGLNVGDRIRVEEILAPKGYLIQSENQEITLADSDNTVTFQDAPAFDPGVPVLKKVKYHDQVFVQDTPLKGAVFKVQYYDNDSCSGDAKRIWYFQTGDDGTFSYSVDNLAQEYENSDLFVDTQNQPKLPLGSVLFTEIKSPAGYLLSDHSLKAKITQPDSGAGAEFSWITESRGMIEVHSDHTAMIGNTEISLAVRKIDASTRKNLKNAKLQILDGESVKTEWLSEDKETVIRDIFELGKTYILREIEAPESYLEAEDISFCFNEQGELELLTENAEGYISADGIGGIIMKDDKMLVLPMTGSVSLLLTIIAGSLLLFGSAAMILRKKKRFFSIFICILSSFMITIPTLAAGSMVIESGNHPEHRYTAYQLLNGTLLGEDELWNIQIAEDIPMTFWDKLESDPLQRSSVEVAEWLAENIRNDADGAFAVRLARALMQEPSILPDADFASNETVTLPDGYYLIISDDAQPMILMVGKDKTVTLHEKSSVPTLRKEIGEVQADGQVCFGKEADSGIGKRIPYRLYGTLPSNYNAYETYYYCFCDQYEAGLQIDLSSVSVTLLDAEGQEKVDLTEGADIDLTDQLLTVAFPDLKTVYPRYTEADMLLVQYDAFLTKEASIGADSNDNDAWIEYTRSPTCEAHGKSVPDRCRLYTWQIQLVKTGAETGNLLANAAFSIKEEGGLYLNPDGTRTDKMTERSLWKTNKNGTVKLTFLDSGKYLITEEQAPGGYMTIEPFMVEICADYKDPDSIVLSAEGKGVQSVEAKTGNVKVLAADHLIPPVPKTGDKNWLTFYLMLLGGSIFLLVIVFAAHRLRKGNKK